MQGILFILPLMLVILSNTLYHFISKSVSTTANPFLILSATYGVSFLGCLLIYVFTRQQSFFKEVTNLKWGSFALGLVIIGIEGGYMLMYKKGWAVSKGSLIANVSVACILLILGYLFFHEQININKLIGIGLCIAGIILMNLK